MIYRRIRLVLGAGLLSVLLLGCTSGDSSSSVGTGEVIVKKSYHPNGKIMVESPRIDGVRHGDKNMYREDGMLMQSTPYKNGNIDGKVKSYYKSGELKSETSWVEGQPEGMMIYYYKDGTVQSESPYVQGSIEGIVKTYYPTGELQSEVPYVHTKPKGMGKEYHKDGTVKLEKTF
ncbi:MAG: toxin-antitoxin system YwqK family antitoxin [Campylobacterota bacterium]|nr:toxin-antitoxin system YwqK family antitoxin [Campylobacterota bacterium]